MRPLALALLATLVAATTSLAQTIVVDIDRRVVPLPTIRPDEDPVVLRSHRVEVDVQDQVATFKVSQSFFNRTDRPLEGTYVFPLPAGSVASSFAMTMNGQMVAGEVLEKNRARQIYEDIVRRRQDPGLLEYVDQGLVRARIFPIPPRQETRIEIELTQILPREAGFLSLRYPLRAHDGRKTEAPSVSAIINLRSKTPLASVFSTSHPIDKTMIDAHHARVSYEGRPASPREELVLYATLADKGPGLHVAAHRLPGEQGTFLLLVTPGGSEDQERLPRDLTFVIDTSGSMAGKKIEQAKEALLFALRTLGKTDRFNVIPFSTEARPFHEAPVVASDENIQAALQRVGEIRAAGGTNIADALGCGMKGLSGSGRVPMVVFLTDGLPTVGETEVGKILGLARTGNGVGARVFVFGVGHDVNTLLLDKLAEESRGTREYVAETEDLELKVSAFCDKISHPVLSDLRLSLPGVTVTDVYPKPLPDLFRGSQLVVLGRYDGNGPTAIRLRGKVGDREVEHVFEATFPDSCTEHGEIRILWAKRKVGYLLDQIRLNGESRELCDEVVRLGKEFGIVTPYTSALVLEDSPLVMNRLQSLGYTGDDRFDFEGRRGGRVPPPASGAPPIGLSGGDGGAFVGRVAVEKSREIAGLKDAETVSSAPASPPGERKKSSPREELEDEIQSRVKTAGGRTFFSRDGYWTDTRLLDKKGELRSDLPVVEIEAFSTKYFELSRKDKILAEILALGKKVRLLHEETMIVVKPAEEK